MSAAAQRIVLWFRNDLRLTDNYIVSEAAKRIAANKDIELVPVYCFDPRHFKPSKTSHGYSKTGAIRAKFMVEAVSDLRARLRAVGSDLVVRHEMPEAVLAGLMKTAAGAGGKTSVLCQEENTSEEVSVDNKVRMIS